MNGEVKTVTDSDGGQFEAHVWGERFSCSKCGNEVQIESHVDTQFALVMGLGTAEEHARQGLTELRNRHESELCPNHTGERGQDA